MYESISVFDWLEMGGAFSYLVVGIGFHAFIGSMVAFILSFFARRRGVYKACRILAFIAAGISLLTIAIGVLGWMDGLHKTEAAAAIVDHQLRQQLLSIGRVESSVPFRLSLFVGLPSLVAAGTALSIAWTKTHPPED